MTPKPEKIEVMPERQDISSEKEWQKLVQSEVNHFRKLLRNTGSQKKQNGLSIFDFTEPMMKRRQQALQNTIQDVCRKYAGNQPLIAESWCRLNFPIQTYSHVEPTSHILSAAAIWVLDQIVDGQYEEDPDEILSGWRRIFKYLPSDDTYFEKLNLLDIWDSQYDYDLIYRLEYVLHYRDEPEKDDEGFDRVLTSERLASGKVDYSTPARKNFQAIIDMIPQESIDRAVEHFEDAFWKWIDRYYEQAIPMISACERCDSAIREEQIRHNRIVDQICDMIGRADKLRKKKQPAPAVPKNINIAEMIRTPAVIKKPELEELLDRSMELAEKLDNCAERIDDLYDSANEAYRNFRVLAMDMSRTGRTLGYEDYGEFTPEPMEPLHIENSYELCFALLYLIEQDNDLPWLYGAGCGLMAEVTEALPWGVYEYDEIEDEGGEITELPKSIKIPDWNERKYKLRNDFFPRSLAQILYEETGCILPRDLRLYNNKAKLLMEYGIRGKDAAQMLILMSTMATVRRQTRVLNPENYSHFGDIEGEEEDEDDGLEKKCEEQKAEIKRLRSALHDAEKGTREAKRELEKFKLESELERRELADLRELIFNQESIEEQESAPETDLFPYTVQKKTLVFGGHDSWAKAIKPLLTGDIRFIEKELSFDVGLIRNVDMIWIQPNAMPHTMYYRIIDNARSCKKPVRYFTYASAVKCAEQLVEADS